MKLSRIVTLLAGAGVVLLPSAVLAQSWNNPAGGLWGTSGNWTGGVFPNATDAIANFGQLNLSSDVTVTVDGPYTVGRLIFGNSNLSPAHSWTVNYSGSPASDYLNLSASSGIALITVSNLGVGQSATINANLNGTSSLWINGPGTLSLAGNNIYSGTTTTVTNGATLVLGALNTLPTNTILVLGDISNRTVKNFANLQVLNSQTVGGFVSQGNVWLTNTTYPTNFVTIPSGQALTVNGNVILGTNSASGTNAVFLNFSGAGSFLVNNPNGIFRVGAADATSTAAGTAMTFDMSGLSTANINLGSNTQWNTSSFYIGDFSTSGPGGVVPSKCLLATNTTITANSLVVGASRRFNAQSLLLGSGSNVLNVNSILLGTNLDYGQVYFGAESGTIRVRATDGASRAFLGIGWGNGTSTSLGASNQFWDCGSHYADLYLTSLQVGYDRRAGPTQNYFEFSSGILDTTELDIGIRPNDPPANSPHLWHNVCDLGGGTINIGSNGIVMGVGGGANAASTATNWQELNISGGYNTVNGDIMLMAQKATNNASGGNEMLVSTFNITGGTNLVNGNIYCCKYVTNPAPHLSSLILNGGVLDLTGHAIGSVDCIGQSGNFTHTPRVPWWVDVISLQSGTLRNVREINGGAANTVTGIITNLVKTGSGCLTLAGHNTYSGGTIVSSGTLAVPNSDGLGHSDLVLAGGTTLSLGSAAPGAGGAFVVANFNLSNATLRLNLDGAAATTSLTATTVSAGGVNNIIIDSITNASGTMMFPLIGYGGADPFGGFSTSVSLPAGYTGLLVNDTTNHAISLSVRAPIVAPSTTTLASSTNPAPFGQPLTLTATVVGTNGIPSGTVAFYNGIFYLGSASMNGSTATLVTSALPIGTDLLTALYGGDVNYQPSKSGTLALTVNFAPPAIQTTPTFMAGGSNLALQAGSTAAGYNYILETTYSLTPPILWTELLTNLGNGQAFTNLIPIDKNTRQQFYRYHMMVSAAGLMPLVSQGRANAVIVIGSSATTVEQFAATELQSYLAQITGGVAFAIMTSDQAGSLTGMNEIVIGQPASNPLVAQICAQQNLRLDTNTLGYDGYVLNSFTASTNTILLLSGSNNRSSLFAVYHLLETLGVRFFGYKSRNGEIVPSLPSPVLPSLNITQVPVMTYRFVDCNNYAPTNAAEVAAVADWGAKNRCNAFMLTPVYPGQSWSQIDLADVQKRGMLIAGPGHILAQLTPATNLFSTHPEYFPLINGARNMEYSTNWGGAVSFCYNNAMSIVVSNVVAYYAQNPFIDLLAIWPPDGSQHSVQCQDSVCSQRTESEWYLTLLNNVDQALRQLPTHPKLIWIAYDELSVPPADTSPYANGADFILEWCNQIRTFGYPMNSASNKVPAQYLQWNSSLNSICTDWKSHPGVQDLASYYRWQNWSNYLASCNYSGEKALLEYYNAHVSGSLEVPMLGYCQSGPWPNNLMQTDFQFYASQGILAWQNCTDYYNDNPHSYWNWLSAQLMWNPQADVAALDQDFYQHVFGPASSVMQTYFTNLWPDIALANISAASSNTVAGLGQYLNQASAIAAQTNNAVLNYWLNKTQSFHAKCLDTEGQNIVNYNQDGSPK